MDSSEQLLAQVPLFEGLPESELRRLAGSLHTCTFSPGEVLFREGEIGDSFYIVRQGQIEIVKGLGGQDERVLAIRTPGEFVGEMSLLSVGGQRTASVRALSQVELWHMSRTEFNEMLHRQINSGAAHGKRGHCINIEKGAQPLFKDGHYFIPLFREKQVS